MWDCYSNRTLKLVRLKFKQANICWIYISWRVLWKMLYHISDLFQIVYNNAISKQQTQKKKFSRLWSFSLAKVTHGPKKVIYNLAIYQCKLKTWSMIKSWSTFRICKQDVTIGITFFGIKTTDLNKFQNNFIKSKLYFSFTSWFFLKNNIIVFRNFLPKLQNHLVKSKLL